MRRGRGWRRRRWRRCCRDLRRFGRRLRRRWRRRWWGWRRRFGPCLGQRPRGPLGDRTEQRQVATHLRDEERVLVAAVGDVELPRLEWRASAPPCVLHDR